MVLKCIVVLLCVVDVGTSRESIESIFVVPSSVAQPCPFTPIVPRAIDEADDDMSLAQLIG